MHGVNAQVERYLGTWGSLHFPSALCIQTSEVISPALTTDDCFAIAAISDDARYFGCDRASLNIRLKLNRN